MVALRWHVGRDDSMKIKVYVVDLELSPRARRIARRVLGGLAIACFVAIGGAIAWASVPWSFSEGEVLSAKKMNENFDAVRELERQVAIANSNIASLQKDVANLQAAAAPLTEVAAQTLDSTDDDIAPGLASRCISGLELVPCSVTANRKCQHLGYKAGWFLGESSTGSYRDILCIR
jgi:hypothetical protein